MRFKPLGKLVRRMSEYFWYYGASDSWRAVFSLHPNAFTKHAHLICSP
jgi:hypothetical protein